MTPTALAEGLTVRKTPHEDDLPAWGRVLGAAGAQHNVSLSSSPVESLAEMKSALHFTHDAEEADTKEMLSSSSSGVMKDSGVGHLRAAISTQLAAIPVSLSSQIKFTSER